MFCEETLNIAINMYKEGKSLTQIGKELNVNRKRLSKEFKKLGITIIQNGQKYFYDYSVFKKIDTEEKAYWLGFLYADGYVNIEKGIELTLAEYDYDHLVKFRKFMGDESIDISYKNSANAYRVCIYSKEIASDLVNLGCIQAKSLILQFPSEEQVPNHLINHFMRGYFDGDGCVYYSHGQLAFSILGTSEFLDTYESYVLESMNRDNPTKRLHDKRLINNTESIQYTGNVQCKKWFDFLYKDATIYLQRKYNKINN